MKCCVPNCAAGKEKSTFGVPKNENLKKQWEENLGIFLKSRSRVCAAHFHETDVIKTWVSGQGLSKYSICMKIPKLRQGAIPFPANKNLILNESTHNQLSVINYKDFSIKHDHCYSSVSPVNKKIKLDSFNSDNLAPVLHTKTLFCTVLNEQVKILLKWFIDIDDVFGDVYDPRSPITV